jgi:hypothetical protein
MNTNRHEFSEVKGVLLSSRRESDSCSFVSIRGSFPEGVLGRRRICFSLSSCSFSQIPHLSSTSDRYAYGNGPFVFPHKGAK